MRERLKDVISDLLYQVEQRHRRMLDIDNTDSWNYGYNQGARIMAMMTVNALTKILKETHPWRLRFDPVPLELYGKPLLIEDFLGNYVVGYYAHGWWVNVYDDEDKMLREENVKKWIPIGSFYGSDAKCKNRI